MDLSVTAVGNLVKSPGRGTSEERAAQAEGRALREMTLEELETLWQQQKSEGHTKRTKDTKLV